MNRLQLRSDGMPAWPSAQDIVLVQTDAASYNSAIERLARAVSEQGPGVFVTANRPTSILKDQLRAADVDPAAFYFVDCVSAMTGVMPPSEEGVTYLESPTMLEKAGMRAEQALRRQQGKYVLIDSLSTLAVYNGIDAVAELTHTLVTRLRLARVGAALVIVDKQASAELSESIQASCDAHVRL